MKRYIVYLPVVVAILLLGLSQYAPGFFTAAGSRALDIVQADDTIFLAISNDFTMNAFTMDDETTLPRPIDKGAGAGISDFDNDGFCEILSVSSEDRNVRMYEGKGLFSFTGKVVSSDAYPAANFTLYPVTDSAVGDFDGNGYIDLAFTGRPCPDSRCTAEDFHSLQVLLNQDGENFDRQSFAISDLLNRRYESLGGLDEGDFNEDGLMDLAVQHYWDTPNENHTHIFFGDETNLFREEMVFEHTNPGSATTGGVPALVAGDFTGDGHRDLIIGQSDDGDPGQTWLFAGDGTGAFTLRGPAYDTNPNVEIGASQPGNGYPDAFDINDDGLLDVIAPAQGIGLMVYTGKAGGTFNAPLLMLEGSDWLMTVAPSDLGGAAACAWQEGFQSFFPFLRK